MGIAVLDRDEKPHQLHILCQCADGQKRHTDIPVYTDGEPKEMTHQWKYSIQGDTLHVTPSVNWLNVFHNAGSWSVRFQEWKPGGDHQCAHDMFRELNP